MAILYNDKGGSILRFVLADGTKTATRLALCHLNMLGRSLRTQVSRTRSRHRNESSEKASFPSQMNLISTLFIYFFNASQCQSTKLDLINLAGFKNTEEPTFKGMSPFIRFHPIPDVFNIQASCQRWYICRGVIFIFIFFDKYPSQVATGAYHDQSFRTRIMAFVFSELLKRTDNYLRL
jgi:hypothetical protein